MRKNMIRGSCFAVKNLEEEPVDKTKHWGDLEEEEEEAEEEEEMEENELGDGIQSVDSLSWYNFEDILLEMNWILQSEGVMMGCC